MTELYVNTFNYLIIHSSNSISQTNHIISILDKCHPYVKNRGVNFKIMAIPAYLLNIAECERITDQDIGVILYAIISYIYDKIEKFGKLVKKSCYYSFIKEVLAKWSNLFKPYFIDNLVLAESFLDDANTKVKKIDQIMN